MISAHTITTSLYSDINNFSAKICQLEAINFRLQIEVEYLKKSIEMYKKLYLNNKEIGHGKQ
jgi:two-component SAPR family response regulator